MRFSITFLFASAFFAAAVVASPIPQGGSDGDGEGWWLSDGSTTKRDSDDTDAEGWWLKADDTKRQEPDTEGWWLHTREVTDDHDDEGWWLTATGD